MAWGGDVLAKGCCVCVRIERNPRLLLPGRHLVLMMSL